MQFMISCSFTRLVAMPNILQRLKKQETGLSVLPGMRVAGFIPDTILSGMEICHYLSTHLQVIISSRLIMASAFPD